MVGHLRILYYSLAIVAGTAILALFVARPTARGVRGRWAFILAYGLSVVHLATVLFATYSMTNLAPAFKLQEVWALGRLINRLRYVALVLFAHEVAWTRLSRFSTIAVSAAVIAGTILMPIVVPGQYPLYVLGGALLYTVCYAGIVYLMGSGRTPGEERLLRALVVFGALSVPCIIVDLLASATILPPETNVYIIDIVPLTVVGFGLVYLLFSAETNEKPPELLQRMWREKGLSRRELEVANLILAGYDNRRIASRLFISVSTVKKHVNHIFAKLGVQSRWEMVRFLKMDSLSDAAPHG